MRRGDEKKEAILDMAERLFYQKGYEQTSVQDILDVLKTSKGSFYHHFESKFEVLETICVRRAEAALSQMAEALGGETDCIRRLNLILRYFMPIREGEERFLALLLPMIFAENGRMLYTQYSQALCDVFIAEVKAVLDQAAAEGKVHLYYPGYTADMILALLNQCWLKAAGNMLDAYHNNSASDPAVLLDILQAYRFAIERVLDAPYGSLELTDVSMLSQTVSRVLTDMRLS
jgi:AcrR family transcriptional regulator